MLEIEEVLCIQNYGISGTTLMHSLLDGHPQLLTLPGLHGREAYEIWENVSGNASRIAPQQYKLLIDHFINVSPRWFNLKNCPHGLDRLGPNKDYKLQIPQDFFQKKMHEYFPDKKFITRKDFIISLFYVFNDYHQRQIAENSILVFPIHSLPKNIVDLVRLDFKKVKVLHMVREPIQNIGSLIKHVTFMTPETNFTFKKGLLNCAFSQVLMERSLHWSRYPIKTYGKTPYYQDAENFESRSINLEDVHLHSRRSMEKICKWLNISWDESLLKSEFMGHAWHNRPESIEQQGLGTNTISQSHNQFLSKFDKWRLETLSLKERKYFGYIDEKLYKTSKYHLLTVSIFSIFPFKSEISVTRFKQQFQVGMKKINCGYTKLILIILSHNLVNYLLLRASMVYKALTILLCYNESNFVKRL